MAGPRVLWLALRPWHILSGAGEILEVVSPDAVQRLRDDGYIVMTDPFDAAGREIPTPPTREEDGA